MGEVTGPAPGSGRRLLAWIGPGLAATARALALTCVAVATISMLAPWAAFTFFLLRTVAGQRTGLGVGSVLVIVLAMPAGLLGARALATATRRLSGRWCAAPIARPYLPRPAPGGTVWLTLLRQGKWLVADPASWRDLLWAAANACGAVLLVAAPPAVVLYGLGFATRADQPGLPVPRNVNGHLLLVRSHALSAIYPAGLAPSLAIPAGLAIMAAGVLVAPRLLPAYGAVARTFLGPTRRSELAQRVSELARSRSETIDTGAAELRRIERDLHDGAQARLVAMGMTLDAADRLLDSDPGAARALLAEARESSVRALAELRDLVRGIHPPVLADRGLAAAVSALALNLPVRTQVSAELAGRPPAPVESAAYFAVSELLANVTKHAAAGQAWVDIRQADGMLRISVGDDGRGGAAVLAGGGLAGVERRLFHFDGVVAVSSPAGGPTVVNLEIPCALSSPKTSSC